MSAVRLSSGSAARVVRIEKRVALLDGRRVEFEARDFGGRLAGITVQGREHRIVTAREGSRIFVWCDGAAWTFDRASTARTAASREHGGGLISPMPGRVRKALVSDGQTVTRGQVLLVLEAMKMEHAIRAPRDGTVRLRVREGDRVEAGVELAELG